MAAQELGVGAADDLERAGEHDDDVGRPNGRGVEGIAGYDFEDHDADDRQDEKADRLARRSAG